MGRGSGISGMVTGVMLGDGCVASDGGLVEMEIEKERGERMMGVRESERMG